MAKAYLEQYPAKKDVPQMERIWGEACFGLNDYQAAIPPLERYRESVSHPQRKPLYELGMSYYYTGVLFQGCRYFGGKWLRYMMPCHRMLIYTWGWLI